MNVNCKRMYAYFDAQTALCAQREQALLADGRSDEASFEKIRANVFGIFRAVLSSGEKAARGDEAALRRFFADRLASIPANWRAALSLAEEHDDAVRAQIEHIKLDALRAIEAQFSAIWEEDA